MRLIFLITAIFLLSINSLIAQQEQVNVRVDGLSCPFCAYGLEKQLIKLDGVENLQIDIEKGLVTFHVQEGKSIPEEEINEAIKKAGFTPKEITYIEVPLKEDKEIPKSKKL